MTHVLAQTTLRDYFEAIITDAIKANAIHPTEETTQYLINLLCQYSKRSTEDALDKALGLIYAEAHHASQGHRISKLKEVGDHSLYLTGFFFESLDRSQVDVKYYETLGRNAYVGLSHLVGKQGDAPKLADVYSELGDAFGEFVDVLMEARLQSEAPQDRTHDMTALYQRWLQTPTRALERRLRAAGFQLDKPNDFN